jgi:hypothetical protein
LADIPKTGYAASIVGHISKDGAAFAPTNDVNPTELGYGLYVFDLLQAETNADTIVIVGIPASTQFAIQPVMYNVISNLADSLVQLARINALIEDAGGDRFKAKVLELAPTAEMSEAELHAALDSYTAEDGSIGLIRDMLESDKVIVTTTEPWTLEYRHKTTKEVLLTQALKNTAGEDITSKENVLGSLELSV